MNLKAIDKQGQALFVRHVKTKQEAHYQIMSSAYVMRVEQVEFKNKKYSYEQIKKWRK